MAERPVFIPHKSGSIFVETVLVDFVWHPGMAPSQKRKNVVELHKAASERGMKPLLETSSKSPREAGRRLSAFHLAFELGDTVSTVESVFQGSKVFENGGPYLDLYDLPSREAKLDERLQTSGKLVAFEFDGRRYPLSPPTAFYDWLYIRALYPHRKWLERLSGYRGFTDIEFNPARSINCQARACAVFVALAARGYLELAVSSFDELVEVESAAGL